jgi:hypothetical protein
MPLGAVSLRWPSWTGHCLSPRCPLVLKPGGMGRGQLWGRFALFALVRGDDGDLPETNASHELGFARTTSAKSAMSSCAHAQHSALRSAVVGRRGDKWRHPEAGHT